MTTPSTQTIPTSTIKEDLIRHEDVVHEVYTDSLGYKTSGIGHREYVLEVGEAVSMEYIMDNFNDDLREATEAANNLIQLDEHPDNVQRVLVNMAFNLGENGLSKFTRMLDAVEENNYQRAADEMKQSVWYGQVKGRAVELEQLMRNH